MYSEVTSVYVPVKTPDYKTWAILLSVLVHGVLVACLWFFYHSPPPPPMETSLVTPEELSQIEGQIKANQMNNAAQAGESAAPMSMSDMLSNVNKSERDPHTAQIMNEIAAKESAWRKEQARIAEQIDKEAAQDQQSVIDQLDAQHAAEQAALNHNLSAEDNLDDIQRRLKEESEAYNKNALPNKIESTDTASAKSLSLGKNGTGQTDNNAGNGTPRSGGSSGNSAGYLNQITGLIKSHWSPPTNSSGKTLKASFVIGNNGSISNISVSGSNDEAFKNSLIQAIQAASPLPPPPNDDDVKRITSTFMAN